MNRKDGFLNLRTNKYKLHFYETASGLKFILNTDLSVGNIRETLHQIYNSVSVVLWSSCMLFHDLVSCLLHFVYGSCMMNYFILILLSSQIYVEYVIKNPLYTQGDSISSELFKSKLDDFVRGLPIFATKLS